MGGVSTVKGLRKQDILDYFSDINYAYNDYTKLNTLSDMLDELMEAVPKWISVKDEMPPMYRMVLITGNNSAGESFGVIKGSYDGDKAQWYRNDIGQYAKSRGDTVTHWMPLPEPPKED